MKIFKMQTEKQFEAHTRSFILYSNDLYAYHSSSSSWIVYMLSRQIKGILLTFSLDHKFKIQMIKWYKIKPNEFDHELVNNLKSLQYTIIIIILLMCKMDKMSILEMNLTDIFRKPEIQQLWYDGFIFAVIAIVCDIQFVFFACILQQHAQRFSFLCSCCVLSPTVIYFVINASKLIHDGISFT